MGDEYPVHALAANGFVVVVYEKPTPYAALEVHGDGLDIGEAMWGAGLFDVRMPLESFKTAIRLLAERGLVDPSRVAVTGLSSGSNDVNYSLIHSNCFAAAIASSSDWSPSAIYLGGAAGEFIREYRKRIGAGRYGSPDGFLWDHMSLALNAERVRIPLLVNASDSEHPQALEEVVALIEHDKPVELVVHPDERHIKWQPAHRLSIYKRNVDWLKFWLQGVEDLSPEKVSQYLRWRKLRDQHIANFKAAGMNYTLPLPTPSHEIEH